MGYFKTSEFILKQKTFFESGKNSDIIFVIENTKIPSYKAILSAHSPVFEAMFSHTDTKEAQENKVNIIDVSADVFKIFLHFIYTGIKPKKYFFELLAAAEKVCSFVLNVSIFVNCSYY